MKVVGFSGYSGSGKTTVIEKLIGCLKASGQRVSVVKHAHHKFDIDQPGKDSWRHRQAGAFEVVVASSRRLAKIREYEVDVEPTVHQLLAELSDCDWAIVEGFKHADLLKVEVWRAETGERVHYDNDPFVVAVATDQPHNLPEPTTLPVFHLDDAQRLADFLLQNAIRHEYASPFDAADA
ncbi:MAG: molybdopterin-guanine dinucleotide biosynthesis protein B [Rhizobacter sp.]